MAAPMEDGGFDSWLSQKLLKINPDTDVDVFVSYIKGILEDEDEELKEAITEILSQVVEDDLEKVCDEIIEKYNQICANAAKDESVKQTMDEKLAIMMANQVVSVPKPRELTDEEKARKKAILMKYEIVSDGDETDEDEEDGAIGGATGGGPPGGGTPSGVNGKKDYGGDRSSGIDAFLMSQNTNAADVLAKEKEKREKAKAESEKKKEKDKTDREKQKQKQNDRKESEKKRTQKGERRR